MIEAAGARVSWEVPVGEAAERETGEALPVSSLARLRELRVALKAPVIAGRCTGGVEVRENGEVRRHPSINNALAAARLRV